LAGLTLPSRFSFSALLGIQSDVETRWWRPSQGFILPLTTEVTSAALAPQVSNASLQPSLLPRTND
jgi:hypothetical protein